MASRILAGTVMLVCVSVFLLPKPSEACSCIDARKTEEQVDAEFRAQYARAMAVFVGRVTSQDAYDATFDVEQVWKGDLSVRVTLQTGAKPADPNTVIISSGDYRFAAGRTYLVFAYGTASRMKSECCTPTNELTLAAKALEQLKSIATPKPPNKAMEPAAFNGRSLVAAFGCRGSSPER
jgi:hypothetical protein